MRSARSPGGAGGFQLLVCLVVACLSFLLGRVSVQFTRTEQPSVALSACPPCVPCKSERAVASALALDYGDEGRPNPQDWNSISSLTGLLRYKPPLQPAHSGVATYTIAPFQVLSYYPRILVFPNFIDQERARAVIRQAEGRLAASTLAFQKGDTEENTKDIRTSQGTFLVSRSDKTGVLSWIEERIAQVTGVPSKHGEPFNVLKYINGQHYDSHFDVFDPAAYGPQRSNRVATVLVYLEAPEEGGETIFPLEGEDGPQRLKDINYKTCDIGFKYKPRTGDAVLFWSTNYKGKMEQRSLHGGCPVKRGTKWVMTKWIRDEAIRDYD